MDEAFENYRNIIRSKDIGIYSDAALTLRKLLLENDPYYPFYHFAPVEGIFTDPNGPIYYKGEYHIFYQYYPMVNDGEGGWTWSSYAGWGHAVSDDLVHWTDWPVAFWPETEYDRHGCLSGNTFVDDKGDLCLMHTGHVDGFEETYGIFGRSKDRGLNFERKMVMHDDQRPNENSPVHWDAQVWKHQGEWYQLTGGATGGEDQQGAAWLWKSPDLENWTRLKNIAPSIRGGWYWELPYLVKLDSRYVLFAGEEATMENPYWVGDFDYRTMEFIPDASGQRMVDNGQYYAYNFHLVDNRGEGNAERRIMHGWITTCGTMTEDVPAWSGAHSIPRVVSIKNNRLWQEPIPEIASWRGRQWDLTGNNAGNKIRKIRGDALEIEAIFRSGNMEILGFKLRISEDGSDYIRAYYDPETGEFGVDGTTIDRNHGEIQHRYTPRAVSQKTDIDPGSEINMHIFLDRSMLEMYVNGYAITSCFFSYPEAKGLDIIASPDGLKNLTIWEMGSMWD